MTSQLLDSFPMSKSKALSGNKQLNLIKNAVSNSFGAIMRPRGSQGVCPPQLTFLFAPKKSAFQNVDLNEPNGPAMSRTAHSEKSAHGKYVKLVIFNCAAL